MKSIVLIGAGQLGSRHLQALVKLEEPFDITVVDPSETSLEVASIRCNEIEFGAKHKVHYCRSLQECLSNHFHYAILATDARYRYQTFLELIQQGQVERIIFEKILFQSVNHYFEVAELLQQKNIKAWVNCPLRVYPFYRELKEQYFNENAPVNYSYTGGEWVGLACNSIHYLDHLHFFTNAYPQNFDFSGLDKEWIASKRDGFIEFTGHFTCEYTNGSRISVKVLRGSDAPSFIKITQNDRVLKVEELTGAYDLYQGDKLIRAGISEPVYQSNLSHRYIEFLESSGDCPLTRYEDSMALHVPFLKGLLHHYENLSQTQTGILPIT